MTDEIVQCGKYLPNVRVVSHNDTDMYRLFPSGSRTNTLCVLAIGMTNASNTKSESPPNIAIDSPLRCLL